MVGLITYSFFRFAFWKDKPYLANELYYTALIKRQKKLNGKIPDLRYYIWYLLFRWREITLFIK